MSDFTPYERILYTVSLIPTGCVAAYGQIADLSGLPRRARMVGRCLGDSILDKHIPWHRVLRSDGKIAFAPHSEHATLQINLLAEEGVLIKHNKVSMKRYQWRPDLPTLLNKLHF